MRGRRPGRSGAIEGILVDESSEKDGLLSRIIRRMRGPALLAILILSSISVPHARQPQDQAAREALAAATAADHQDMMAQLGIRKLRPGPSGNESAPNHANYDEALANPYPILPESSRSRTARR